MSTDTSITKWLHELMAELEGERARVDELIGAVQLLVDYQKDKTPTQPVASVEEVRDGVIDILTENDQVMHRNSIAERLQEMGIRVGGKNPTANLGAILSREWRFFSAGNGEWGLKQWKNSTKLIDDSDQDEDPEESAEEELVVEIGRTFADVHAYLAPESVYEHLKGRGVNVPGDDPLLKISQLMGNDNRFQQAGNRLWGLTRWQGKDLRKTQTNTGPKIQSIGVPTVR